MDPPLRHRAHKCYSDQRCLRTPKCGPAIHKQWIQDKTRQDNTFVIIILPVQFLGTKLAENASRGVPNYSHYKTDITDCKREQNSLVKYTFYLSNDHHFKPECCFQNNSGFPLTVVFIHSFSSFVRSFIYSFIHSSIQ